MQLTFSLLPTVVMEEAKTLLPQRPTRSFSCLRRDYFPCIPARYVLAIMISIGFAIVFGLRVNLSVAIIQMVNGTATVNKGSARVFSWTESEQGWVLAAFFYGYLLTQIPGGWLAQRVGGKWVFGVGIFVPSLLTIFTPLAADTSVWLLVALRVLEGLFEGVTFPAAYAMVGKWAPALEKSTLIAIISTGSYLGNIVSFPLSGVLCQYGFDGGWPSVFYLFGILGILWFLVWIFLAYSTPATHPRISRKEREYIQSSVGESTRNPPTPWLEMLTSPALWAIIIANFSYGWGSYTLLTCMPTYFKQALPSLEVNSHSVILSGVYSAIPYTTLPVLVPVSGKVADFLRARYLPTVVVRKGFTFIAFTGSATFLLLCGYLGTSTVTAVLFLTLAIMFSSLMLVGANTNHLDIAPRYAGVLFGITNLATTLPGILGPQVAKAIAIEPNAPEGSGAYLNGYRDEWREVFIIAAEIYIFGAIVYIILASGKKQPWANGRCTKEQHLNPALHGEVPCHRTKHLQQSKETDCYSN